VRGLASEVERQDALRVWVQEAWVEYWDEGKLHYIPPWDALEVLELAPRGLAMGMCTHKGAVFAQVAAAMGYNARVLIANGHCAAEVWSNQLGRWVVQDPGPGLSRDRSRTIGCSYEVGGQAASALDIHRSDPQAVRARALDRDRSQKDGAGVWCGKYDRFAIPLRNDHLSRPEPAEDEHGFGNYRYDSYLWWSDDLDEPVWGEYSFLSNRPADFYPVLNRAWADLTESAPGSLTVTLRSETPNLGGYRVRIDGGDERLLGEEPFPWPLHQGENRLQFAAENVFGVRGAEERVVLAYAPE
jgi:hypothetical protein